MIFESLWPLAFLLAVPVVVILYLLVPKGTDTPVSSNLLWKKLFYNEQSKTFWEKFLHNLLMYLQIVILLLLILALMAPFIQRKGTGSKDVVYLIDTSGSMKHLTKGGNTRLGEAVSEIKEQIAASDGAKISIVTCDGTGTNLLAVHTSEKKHCIGRWQTSRARTQPDRFLMHWQPYRRCRKKTKRTIWQMSSSIPTALGQNRRKISKVSFRQPSAWWEVPFLTWRIRFCPAPKTAAGTRIRLHQA
ncbi:MAG: BatA domain-containing protein [Roseburia faecis]